VFSILSDRTSGKTAIAQFSRRDTGRSQFLWLWRRSPLQMLHDWRGDRTSEKTCDRPVQQRKNRAIAFTQSLQLERAIAHQKKASAITQQR
jgi:hypothetical protein